ncbi:hypothetical protein ST47_g8017 [Ascochyta rabiei]|uniref:Uncharacterized protein n=1 Tax=Didymella rabiei TaxID=5454 RepID=A0A162ZXM4_DIDRA|nr:hypothetical protein ST47_g8017 [Ascochyta rabiei]
MALLAARACRLLRAPHGPWPCLQRPASTVAARSHAADAENKNKNKNTNTNTNTASADAPKIRYTYKKLALVQHKQPQRQRARRARRARHPLTPAYHDSDIVPADSAILIPASATATPRHFVDKIEPLDAALVAKRNLVVFLVTPSFAPWLLDDAVFLEKALGQLYSNISAPTPVAHAICAVVDKLPAATPLRGHDVFRQVGTRAAGPPVNETGFEGIAYLALPAKAELSALPQLPAELACIDFLAHTHTQSKGRRTDRIRVPLANTVFHTGESTTLIKSTWERRSHGSAFQRRTRVVRNAAAINLSAEDPKLAHPPPTHIFQEASALSIPLVPLTSPRQVDGHMGNIIRGLVRPDGSKMTASTELEQVVPRYFNARAEPAQATSAWALVIPNAKAQWATTKTREWLHSDSAASAGSEAPDPANHLPRSPQEEETLESWEAFWQKDPPLWSLSIQKLIAMGARLHKVLSVPLGAPVPHKKTSEGGEADGFDSFFISPTVARTQHVSTFQHLKSLEQSAPRHAWSWEFGVVPSTVDSMPGGSWQHTTSASEDMVVFRGSFGALTEGSLTLMRGLGADPKTGLAQPLGATSIDVPFSRWSGIRLLPKESRAKEEAGSNTEPKANIDSIHDAPILTISSQPVIATASLPFRTSRRPQNNQAPTANHPTTRAKSTSAKLRDVNVTKQLKQGHVRFDFAAPHTLEAKAKREPTSKLTSSTSTQPEERRPLLRNIVSSEPDRFVVRKLIINRETTGSTRNKPRDKDSVPAAAMHKERLGKGKETPKARTEKKGGHLTIRRVLAAAPSHADTKTDKAKPSADEVVERTRVSGKILARLTEQLKLITGLKGSDLDALGRWRQRSKTRSTSTPALRSHRRRNLVRRVSPRAKDGQTPGLTLSASDSQPAPTPGPSATSNLTPRQRITAAHRSPHGLDFTMRSIPLFTHAARPSTTADLAHALGTVHARLRAIIHRTRLLNLRLSTLLPGTPTPITKHASKPLGPQRPTPRSLYPQSRHATRRGTRAVRKIATRPLALKMRPDGARAPLAAETRRRGGGRMRVKKFETVGLRVRRLRRESKRVLEDEVAEWLGGGGGGV